MAMVFTTALAQLLPDSRVTEDGAQLSQASTATFATTARCRAIVAPSSLEDVGALLRYCTRERLTLHVVSQGRNWGFGSRVPTRDVDILLDLSGMNRILAYDEEHGTVRCEPGVTFAQLAGHLRERGNRHFLGMIGGDPRASVVGNLLERGDVTGPCCERSELACGLEVVLADGAVVDLGYENVEGSRVAHLSKAGLGPGMQELFFQSNYGVVTKATLWLSRVPNHARSFRFRVREAEALSGVLSALRGLYQRRVLTTPVALWNDYKQVVTSGRHPWLICPVPPLGREALRACSNDYSAWCGFGGVYVDHPVIAAEIVAELSRSLTPALGEGAVESWEGEAHGEPGPLYGQPTTAGSASLYWRKRGPVPDALEPEADRCGVLWNAFLIPFAAAEATGLLARVDAMVLGHGFEPVLSVVSSNERCLRGFQSVLFDRDAPGADAAALQCHRDVFALLEAEGCSHSRLDVLTMESEGVTSKGQELQRRIKEALDPARVISPGRYAIP